MNTILKAESFRFPRSVRLRTKREYRKLFLNGKKFSTDKLNIHYTFDANGCQLGISVSKKFGKSHLRNRFKRVVREAFRKVRPEMPNGLKIHVAPRKTLADISLSSYEAQLDLLRFKEGIRLHDRATSSEPEPTTAQSC